MFAKISRAQLLAVTGWSTTDLDNRAHANQLALAFGLMLPAENGAYLGLDCIALKLSDALVEVGFTRAQAAQFVRDHHEKWLQGISRLEWPEHYPPAESIPWAPTKLAIDEGEDPRLFLVLDSEVYFAVVKKIDGAIEVVCGTMGEITTRVTAMVHTAPAFGPAQIRQFNLRQVYDAARAAAAKPGVDLGVPFTRPEKHPDHRDWYAAIEVHRALSAQRAKVRKPPGPARAKAKGRRPARAPAGKRLLKA